MIKILKFIAVLFVFYFFCKCGSSNKLLNSSQEEKVIISFGKYSSTDNLNFTFNSNNKKLISIGFLDKFNDTIMIFRNAKKKITFYRTDSLSYKNLKHEEIFKFIETNKNDRVTILLKKSKKKISFNLIDDKKLYLVSHYEDTWYVTIWD